MSLSAKQVLGIEMALVGARPLHRTRIITPGPFLFTGVITDNAVIPADLTLIAAQLDPRIRDVYTTDNPKLVYVMEGVEFFLEQSGLADTEALIADLFEDIYLYHKDARGIEDRLNVYPFAGTTLSEPAVSTTVGSSTVQRYAKKGRIFELPSPWAIDCDTDTFEVAGRAGVNTSANVPFQLVLHGYAYPSNHGVPMVNECIDAAQAAKFRDARILAANRRQAIGRDRS